MKGGDYILRVAHPARTDTYDKNSESEFSEGRLNCELLLKKTEAKIAIPSASHQKVMWYAFFLAMQSASSIYRVSAEPIMPENGAKNGIKWVFACIRGNTEVYLVDIL